MDEKIKDVFNSLINKILARRREAEIAYQKELAGEHKDKYAGPMEQLKKVPEAIKRMGSRIQQGFFRGNSEVGE